MGLRQDLATHLRATMADVGIVDASALTVYPAGVDIVDVPCVVINPGDPYIAVVTMKQNGLMFSMSLHLITNRNDPETAFDYLEDLRRSVTDSVKTFQPSTRWITFGSYGLTEVGGVGYATAVVEISMVSSDA